MKTLIGVARDLGNARMLFTFQREAAARGCRFESYLDPTGAAWDNWLCENGSLRKEFADLDPAPQAAGAPAALPWSDAALVMMSASGKGMEQATVVCALARKRPVYGFEDVPGGRHNPGWTPDLVASLRRLFAVMPVTGDECVVGPPQVERYRGVDVSFLGHQARRKLCVADECPLIWYSGHPNSHSPHALSRVGEAIGMCTELCRTETVLVVSRHGREITEPVWLNHEAHQHTMRYIRDQLGIRVIDCSIGYEDQSGHAGIYLRPLYGMPTYQELLCACASNGVVVTGFGTDGMIVAPHLQVPSVLFLNPFTLGALWRAEKKIPFPQLPVIPRPMHTLDLAHELARALLEPEKRQKWKADLATHYPFPEANAAARVIEVILSDLG